MSKLVSILLLVGFVSCIEAKILRPSCPKSCQDYARPVPCLPTETCSGSIEQQYDKVFVISRGRWDYGWWAVGKILPDDTVLLLWISNDGSTAWGEYHLDESGNLEGRWSYSCECQMLENGHVFPLKYNHTMTKHRAHR